MKINIKNPNVIKFYNGCSGSDDRKKQNGRQRGTCLRQSASFGYMMD